jgi:cytidylate kinase
MQRFFAAEERARRRYNENLARGSQADYETILAGVRERDRIDSTRDIAPLRAAEDAVVINSDELGIEQVFGKVRQLCHG